MITEQIQVEKKQLSDVTKLSFKEKLHLMAETIRNHLHITQTTWNLIKDEKMCVFGVLGFGAGISKEQLRLNASGIYDDIFAKYGLSNNDQHKQFNLTYIGRKYRFISRSPYQLFTMNDAGMTFPELADELDFWASQL